MLHHDESSEHLVRRLESFSDVVIGFSLAEVSLSLTVHGGFTDMLNRAPNVFIGFAWTFFVVCQLWYMHHRLFARAFIPGRLSIFLNFVWLGTVGLIVYLLQVYLHFVADLTATRFIFEGYFFLYGLNLAILAWLYAIGLRTHAGRFDAVAVLGARTSVLRLGVAAAVILLLVASGPFLSMSWFFAVIAPSIGYGFLAAGIAIWLTSRSVRR